MRTVRAVGLAIITCVLVAAPARVEAGDGKNLLPLLADDVEMVLVVDLADARGAATFDAVVAAMPPSLSELVTRLQRGGIDLVKDVDTFLVAGSSPTYVSVVEGRFGADQLGKLKAGTAKKHRGVRYWVDGDTAMAMLGKRLVVTSGGQITDVIDRHKKKRRARGSASAGGLRDGLAAVDTRHDLWMVMSGDALAARSGASGIEYLTFGATFGADLALQVRAVVTDDDRQALFAETLDRMMPQVVSGLEQLGLAALAASLTVEWEGRALDLAATVTAGELSTLLTLLAAM